MPNSPAALTFEAALTELEGIVRQLESGKTSLEDSVSAYERGMELRGVCETRLKEAQLKVQKVSVGADGTVTATELNPDTLEQK